MLARLPNLMRHGGGEDFTAMAEADRRCALNKGYLTRIAPGSERQAAEAARPLRVVVRLDQIGDVIAQRVASGHLNRQLTQPPRTLDPAYNEDIPGLIVLSDLFEGLVRLDPEGRIVPAVAKEWEVSPDGLVYRFHLRPEAAWSDGEPVTAGDFVFGMRRIVRPETASPR